MSTTMGAAMPPLARQDVLLPRWPVPPRVRAVFTTRRGGVSRAPWDSLNLGTHVGDDAHDVAANRARLAAYLAGHGAARAVFLEQVHGLAVLRLSMASADGACADGAATQETGLACTVMVADCLPVLLATRDGCSVAAAHAGWRGLAGQVGGDGVDGANQAGVGRDEPRHGILEAAVASLRQLARSRGVGVAAGEAGEVIAWLGPCIGPSAFEVGEDVKAAFGPAAAGHFRPGAASGKYWADLPALARWRLGQAGVVSLHGNDGGPDWCTHGRPEVYFSHRRDAARLGSTGRMAACVWIDADADGALPPKVKRGAGEPMSGSGSCA